jgi:hypothetical protein
VQTHKLDMRSPAAGQSAAARVLTPMCCVCPFCGRIVGDISVRRVAGKLHFAVHQQSFVDVLPQVRPCAADQWLFHKQVL